ncbi:AAA family ATPase [Stakelama pacifica]|uniref:MoxR-like ATPase n=1 Tax=Stakelama pacifica TaxID=517720 RepID=A0A4R6FD47_9SPHN|nr:MoxR family ATPase [Stakelama pacifica]MAX01118.1 magnesium chelatase [Sphingomonas sp.]TDN79062.1 MoxR-like ATPase [Stakelama pacifica]GGO98710.1 MoxR-like ATPase [Stakelama pacifica]
MNHVRDLGEAIQTQIAKAVIGEAPIVRFLAVALFSSGHVLLEGAPGTAKTLLAQSFARTLGLDFGRIQFTPDLMPGDIIGSNLFNFQTSTFALTKGPVFCELLLADEINRTPPKTQAALLEAMQERRVTIDGRTETLSDRFTVVATQNPIEQQGVYPLPEAQLDRFLFKLAIDYPTIEAERAIVAQYGARSGTPRAEDSGVEQVADADMIARAIASVSDVRLVEEIIAYIVDLIRATRDHPDLATGASPRAASAMAAAARAAAALEGRDYVIPDDVKLLALPLLRHRVILSPTAEIDGRRTDDIIAGLIDSIEAPR